jgi:predicted GNAT family N-acyltransferase
VAVAGFYRRLGYVVEGDLFEEAGIPHVAMRKRIV